ncbi:MULTISPECIES: hypothetical protein [unclassified Helicobacter]|nr:MULTISPECIES: hypothetical protein [unclassified Helicobacter]
MRSRIYQTKIDSAKTGSPDEKQNPKSRFWSKKLAIKANWNDNSL